MMTVLKGNLSVELHGRGSVTIRPSNYIATGGEGSVYKLHDTIVKLYTDTDRMSREGTSEKLEALSRIRYEGIVSPGGVVRSGGKDIGYYMPFVEGEPLSRMFTNDFIVRSSITETDVRAVVKDMRGIVQAAHRSHAVMVDANELNWIVTLAKGRSPAPYVIDVDSWSIGRWKGSVIMPSIRDWHAKQFDEKSDWFAWGVVTFQLFTGIHPYKGILEGFTRGDLEARMKANASVFSKGIKLNHAVRDLSLIPQGLRGWYEAVFQNGERSIPPENFEGVLGVGGGNQTYRMVLTKSGSLSYTKLSDFTSRVVNIFPCGVVLLADGTLYDLTSKKVLGKTKGNDVAVIEMGSGYVVAELALGKSTCVYVDKKSDRKEEIAITFEVKKFTQLENRLFAVTDQGLMELAFHEFAKVVCSPKTTWNALSHSSEWLDGFGVQNALNAVYLIYPYRDDACAHVRIPELDGVTILAGVRGKSNASLVGLTRKGEMVRSDIAFNSNYKSYTCTTSHVDNPNISQVTLPKGVTVEIVDDGKLEVRPLQSASKTIVEDRDILSDGKLYRKGDTVLYVRGMTVWSISMH